MRKQLEKLQRGRSTKAERRFAELLKAYHIPFRTKVLIQGREVDFVIKKYAIEIDGHEQDVNKNKMLMEQGFIPLHFKNYGISQLKEWIKHGL